MRALARALLLGAMALACAGLAQAAQFGFTVAPVAKYTGDISVRTTDEPKTAEGKSAGLPYSVFLRSGPFHFAFLHYEQTAEKQYPVTVGAANEFQSTANVQTDAFTFSYVYDFVSSRDLTVYSSLGLALLQSRWVSTTFDATLIDFKDTRVEVSEKPALGGMLMIGSAWTLEQSTLVGVELRYIGGKTKVTGTATRFGVLQSITDELDVSGVQLGLIVGVGF
jgi:hypothetical protein